MAFLSDLKLKFLVIGVLLTLAVPVFSLRPVDIHGTTQVFEIAQGERFWQIIGKLQKAGLIRSSSVTGLVALGRGQAGSLKPGRYQLSPAFSSVEIIDLLENGARHEVTVVVPDGASLYEVDMLLAKAGVLLPNSLLPKHDQLEGRLFPDTYRFFSGASSSEVIDKLTQNFEIKIGPLLPAGDEDQQRVIILASLVEKEVPNLSDGQVVAGILEKRLRVGMPLQVDATLCYAKLERAAKRGLPYEPCTPPSASDKAINSPYNTYRNKGLPPGPIGNPSRWAFEAVLGAKTSPYWFYISDPKTGATIFAKTLEEHNRNIAKYLR